MYGNTFSELFLQLIIAGFAVRRTLEVGEVVLCELRCGGRNGRIHMKAKEKRIFVLYTT